MDQVNLKEAFCCSPLAVEAVLNNITTNIFLKPMTVAELSQHSVVVGPTGKGMSVLPELLQDEYQNHGGKPVIFDKSTSLSGLMNQGKEEA